MAFFINSRDVTSGQENNSASSPETLTVAIVGFGTVGQAATHILCARDDGRLQLTHICNRNVERKRVDWVPDHVTWTDDFEAVLASDVDIVVELIGGQDPATNWIRRALEAGKSVVTANKQVIARCGADLVALVKTPRQHLCFEAAVAGGIPVIRGLQEGLAGDRLFRIRGILNGTCNYILTRMEDAQVSFTTALEEAQDLGFAEADPTADVDGFDAQAKLAILSAVGLRRPLNVETIPLRSITTIEPVDFVYADRLGCTIRQVSQVELDSQTDGYLVASVQPTLVPRVSALARVEGSRNVVVVEGEFGGETAFSGLGAGGNPTAVAVVSDLESITRGGSGPPMALGVNGATATVRQEFTAPHYVRFVVADRPGIIAALAEVFSQHGVNVDSVLQEPGWSKDKLPFVVTLESCSSVAVERALRESAALDFHVRPPLLMPMLT